MNPSATPEIIHKIKVDARTPPAAPASEAATGPAQFEDPIVSLVVQTSEELLGVVEDLRLKFSLKIAGLETQIATLNGGLEVLKAKRGVRGPPGVRGEPGARIISWKVDTFAFECVPTMSDGSTGAPLPLKEIIEILARRAVAEAARQ
jgi:hypothetical protein